MTNLNFLGSRDILTVLRACLWKKQASQHFYTKVKSVPVEAGFTEDCSSHGVNPQEALESRLEGPERVDCCLNAGVLNCLRSNHKLTSSNPVRLSLGIGIPALSFKIYEVPFYLGV